MLDGGGEHVAQLFQAQRLLRGEEDRFQNQFQFHAILRQRGIRRLWTGFRACDRYRLRWGRRDSADLNLAKRLALHSGDLFETDQFEQRKKGHHHFGTAGNALEQFGKSKARTLAERPHQVLDLLADRPFVFEDVPPVFRSAEPLEDDVDGVDQVEDGGFRARGLLRRKFQFAGCARENVFLPGFEDLELRRGILEFLVFDQLADQFPARVFALIFAFHLRLLLNGQQFAALDIHQIGICAAASLNFLYSTSWRINSQRGSSPSSSPSTCACCSTGSSSRLLIYIRVAAITRNSPAISRSNIRKVSMYSMNWVASRVRFTS